MFFLILLIHFVSAGYITTWDLSLEYDIEGKLSQILIPFKLENTINSGYLQFGGASLHKTIMSEVTCIISTLDGSQLMTTPASVTTQPSFTSDYYFLVSVELSAATWYHLKIFPTQVDSGFYYEPITLRTISSLDDNAMIYDYNYGAGFLNVDDLPPSGMTVTFNVDETLYPNYLLPGAQYVITIDITPRQATDAAQIDLQIVKGSHSDGIDDTDYQILSSSCWSSFTDYTCTTTQNSIKLVTTNSVVANIKFQVQFGVENPGFVSNRDIRIVTKSPSKGYRIIEKGIRTNVFQVSPVVTQLQGVEYLWGVDYLEDLTDTLVGIFTAKDITIFYGPYNSIKISFSVAASVNLIAPLVVSVKLSCLYALSYATKHNFQQYDDQNPVYCKFVTDSMVCYNVGTLSSSSVYYISTKAIFTTAPGSGDLGTFSFYLDNSGTQLQIYGQSTGITPSIIIQDQPFLDTTGWHSATGQLGQTQVVSIPDTSLTSLNSVFGSNGAVGIANDDNMILFFLKVPSTNYWDGSVVSCPTNSVQTKMTIMMNNQMLHSDQNNLPKKLEYLANDGGGVYSDDQFKCIQTGLCDVGNQNTYTIYSATNTGYGIATFSCGNGCSSNFVTECNNFMGTTASPTQGSNGVVGIPVSFAASFTHSSQYADEQLMDFVVSFYKVTSTGQSKLSSHLINAYTITRIMDINAGFVNYYMGTTTGNNGNYIPTMFRVKMPSLTVSYDKIQVFFDTKIQLFSSYSGCQVFNAQQSHTEAWMLFQSVLCDKADQVLLPVIPNGLTKTVYIALTTTVDGIISSVPVRVYRAYGLPVNSETRAITVSPFTTETADLTLPFVRGAYAFNMQIDTTKFVTGQAKTELIATTSSSSTVPLEQNQNIYIGAGLTLTSLGINVFEDATISSYFGALSCAQVFYNTNMYAIFCPFDTKIHYPLSLSNEVVFVLGQFTKLGSFISYGISGAKGFLMAAMNDPGSIGRLLYTCTLDKTNTLHSNSLGQQRVQFPIRFSSSIKLGGLYYASVKVVISFTLAINGVNVVTSTSICGIQGLPSITCTYTSTSTVLTVTLTSSVQQTIAANTVIYLTFQLQSTYGLTSFGSNQPYTVSIYVPTVRSGRTQTYGDTYDTPAVLQEQCTYTQLTLSNSQLGNTFYIGNMKLEIPITNAVGTLAFDFGLKSPRDYLSASQTYVLLNLGFLSDSNSGLDCQIYENNALSTLIYSIDTTLPNIVVKFNQDITNPHNRVFQMRCKNYKTPTDALQSDSFIGKLIDKVGTTTVQSSAPIGYSTLSSVSYTNQGSIALKSKSLNSPGFNSIYEFAITNGDLKILLTSLIKFRFHEGISQSGSVSCQMNGTFCYCSQQGGLYTIEACVVILPTQLVIITITLPQPNRFLWPISPNIYVAVDQDNDFSNGVYMQAVLSDYLGEDYETQAMEVVDTTISSQYIRTTQTHKLSLLLPSGSVSAGNTLYTEFPSFYMDPLSRAVNITCTLTRDDDNTQTNFTTTCKLLTSQYISMILAQDSSNNLIKQYTLQLGNIPLPQQQVPTDPQNDFRIKVHISQSGDTRAKFTSAFYYSTPLYLISEDKEDVKWTGSQFKYERDEALTLVSSSSDIIKIYQGTFRTLIKLSPLDQAKFAETFGFQTSSGLVAYPSTLSASSGSSSANFLVGTLNTIGYQVFQFTKLTGGSNYVSTLPNIYAKVVHEPCQLTTPQLTYQIVQGGVSQPIIVDIQSCFPMSDLRIELMNNNASLNVISNNPQNILYDGNSGYKLYFDQFQYIWEVSNNDTLELNSTVELWFNLTGVSSQYYLPPPNITIIIVESTSTPMLEFSSQPVAYKNQILFTFNCTTPGTLFWVIGCGDNIGYIPLGEIYNRTIYEGYSRTLRNISDTEWKIYGMQLLDGIPVQENFNGLKSYSDYTMISYCVDSPGSTSDALSFDWQTNFNGGSGIKLNITFSSSLTTTQALELVCGINLIFPIDYTNICNQQGYQCDLNTLTTLSASTDSINVLDGVITSYYIYIQPDLSLMTENINTLVEQQLSNKATFFSLLQNKMSLDPEQDPTILSVTYSEPDQNTQPILNHTTPVVGSINATMNFTLSKAPGYVGIGLEQTDTSSIPTVTQLRRSINYLGRSLDQSYLLFFNYSSSIQNETKKVVFTHLSPNLKYQIYWFYSNDDAGPLTLISNVSMIQIQTSPSQTYSYATIIVVIVLFWIA